METCSDFYGKKKGPRSEAEALFLFVWATFSQVRFPSHCARSVGITGSYAGLEFVWSVEFPEVVVVVLYPGVFAEMGFRGQALHLSMNVGEPCETLDDVVVANHSGFAQSGKGTSKVSFLMVWSA